MKTSQFRDTGKFVRRPARSGVLAPGNLAKLMRCLEPNADIALPIRIQGAGSASTDCNQSPHGTVVRTTEMNKILRIDSYNHTVTAEAGVRLGALVAALARQGLELVGNHDQMERTLGGALASPCMGPGIGEQAGYLSDQVINMKIVTADGKLMNVSEQKTHLLNAFRLSYGLLGVIYEATLRVRPISTFSASHRGLSIDRFSDIADHLSDRNVGLKFYVLPHRDRVYVDLRRFEADPGNAYAAPWKIKDWGESTVLPNVFRSLNRVMPIPSVRYKLIDSISAATHGLVNTKLVNNGNNVAAAGRRRRTARRNLLYSTWCFPASDFSVVIKAYAKFCQQILQKDGYRCDMPAIGFRVSRDTSALLSPSFDEPVFALQTTSTQRNGWDDFVIDLAQFAENWGGTPLFSQSRAFRAEQAAQSYSTRLEFFRKIRRKLDPDDRLLNPFLARSFQ
ncbi:MAG: FAD-binding oxidoreductase [Gammaproteobacteria bacterium]|nr:FAD-binding oxidoreductase [Gammaproteobacteria bacterium]MBU2675703.1 FAD-binding oxidoreductase [Gammaproteobacteria bacterium]NNC56872.1 FAD-binding oxidoreductase [Woeseiaceae bacterium]NNL49441.1 FAD-binding oxidoreductase [Woeseiaceae bacterium]